MNISQSIHLGQKVFIALIKILYINILKYVQFTGDNVKWLSDFPDFDTYEWGFDCCRRWEINWMLRTDNCIKLWENYSEVNEKICIFFSFFPLHLDLLLWTHHWHIINLLVIQWRAYWHPAGTETYSSCYNFASLPYCREFSLTAQRFPLLSTPSLWKMMVVALLTSLKCWPK